MTGKNACPTVMPKRIRHRIVTVSLLLFLVWFFVAWIAARALVVKADLASADALVVLSGSSSYLERTQKAAELYRQGRAPLVLLTNDHTRGGWSSAQQTNPFFVDRAMDELINHGVPLERIRIVPGVATSTQSEAEIVKSYAATQGLRSVLIITSAYHSKRALRTFRKNFEGTGVAIGLEPATIGPQTSVALWWLYPSGWRDVAGEYGKLIYYWFVYA
jgi:uncharacterized SAM-binding protein YcdF (DUF218 family)